MLGYAFVGPESEQNCSLLDRFMTGVNGNQTRNHQVPCCVPAPAFPHGGSQKRNPTPPVRREIAKIAKANRIETMKGPAESGQICSVGRRKIAKKIAKNKRCYANTLRPLFSTVSTRSDHSASSTPEHSADIFGRPSHRKYRVGQAGVRLSR